MHSVNVTWDYNTGYYDDHKDKTVGDHQGFLTSLQNKILTNWHR